MERKLSSKGYDLIKKWEGCRLKAYKPVSTERYWTIGWGHYGADVLEGMTITQEQADRMLEKDMERYEQYVNDICDYLKLNQNQFDALVSFTYNLGSGNLLEITKNKTRTTSEIADRIEFYNKAGGKVLVGLQRRRAEEKELFLTPVKEVRMIDGVMDALDFLVDTDRITNKEFWLKALDTTHNVNYLLIKWAKDVAVLEANDLL